MPFLFFSQLTRAYLISLSSIAFIPQVNVTLKVVQHLVFLNNHTVPVDQLSSLRLTAMMYEKVRATGAIVSQRHVSVVIAVSVLTGPDFVNVQELILYALRKSIK